MGFCIYTPENTSQIKIESISSTLENLNRGTFPMFVGGTLGPHWGYWVGRESASQLSTWHSLRNHAGSRIRPRPQHTALELFELASPQPLVKDS